MRVRNVALWRVDTRYLLSVPELLTNKPDCELICLAWFVSKPNKQANNAFVTNKQAQFAGLIVWINCGLIDFGLIVD
jgi:hypothetical protein